MPRYVLYLNLGSFTLRKYKHMDKPTKKMQKLIDEHVNHAYSVSCNGIQVSIWDLSKILSVGNKAYLEGKRDQELGDAIREFVEIIRKN